ncbi:MAG: DNA polymerase III subunit gamma/tau [Oscillospiraceae bacterium]|nr:DNA polymerase III subunit gamma/tau [Oscillospiraceae bacterium]
MYQALYRKWRPRTFDDVVGQSHITDTLKRQIAAGRPSHAYLFTGTRGTGKTTCAKILSRAVNCHAPVDGNPCNVCPACLGIESGAILDVLELDAASNNGVDQVRALRDEAVYTPAAVKKRVYIVDEVHMLSPSAFNALLKIMEEPPEHLMFILATTELHKVPATVKSRCQQFSFKRILPGDISSRLSLVAGQEGIDLTDSAAALLARLADGGMRDALSLLDQCAAAGTTVDDARVLDTLGLAGNLDTAKLMEHIADGDTASALELLGRLYAAGKDVGAILGELSCLTRDLLLRRTAPQGAAGLLTGGFDETTLRTLGERFSAPRLMQILTLLQQANADLPRSTSRRTDAELCLIRLCDVTLDESVSGLAARLTRLEEVIANGGVPAPAPVPKAAPKPAAPAPTNDPPPWQEDPAPTPKAQPAPAPVEPPPAPASKPAPAPAPSGESGSAFWDSFVTGLRGQISMAAYPYLSNRTQVRGVWNDGVLTVWVPDDFTKTILNKPAVTEIMAKAASARFGGSVRVTFSVGTPPAETVSASAPAPASAQETGDALDALLDFGKFDNITIN